VRKQSLNDILNKAMVLVLNGNWQAVNVRTLQEAFCTMANVATGLEIEGENHVRPVIAEFKRTPTISFSWESLSAMPPDTRDFVAKFIFGGSSHVR
jgi:hypothetical protein